MTIGTAPNAGSLNAQLTATAVQLRAAAAAVITLAEFINQEGAAGLQTIGFTAADATAYVNMIGYLSTVAGVYYGTATQGTQFNFDTALATIRAGQG